MSDCIKLYYRDNLIGILTHRESDNLYLFVRNKLYVNPYIDNLLGLKDEKEVYVSKGIFNFFLPFIVRYGDFEGENDYSKLEKIANLNLNRERLWIGV